MSADVFQIIKCHALDWIGLDCDCTWYGFYDMTGLEIRQEQLFQLDKMTQNWKALHRFSLWFSISLCDCFFTIFCISFWYKFLRCFLKKTRRYVLWLLSFNRILYIFHLTTICLRLWRCRRVHATSIVFFLKRHKFV
jgi:hypothetical protein